MARNECEADIASALVAIDNSDADRFADARPCPQRRPSREETRLVCVAAIGHRRVRIARKVGGPLEVSSALACAGAIACVRMHRLARDIDVRCCKSI